MIKQALGERSEFSSFHPFVNLLYFAFAIGISMFLKHPLYLFITFCFACIYSILLGGKSAIKFNIVSLFSITLIMSLANGLFTHNGGTVLFFLNDNRITFESIYFGFSSAVLFVSVIIWFSCFNKIMSSEKLVFLFGKAAPTLGLTLSMIFRFIPLLKKRFKEIDNGQKSMGRAATTFTNKIRQFGKEVSILISWSLESSIETADSMSARGYGLPGRTSFTLFRFSKRDTLYMVLLVLLGGITIYGIINGVSAINFYPFIKPAEITYLSVITAVSFGLLLVIPIVTDVIGEIKWQQLK